MSVKGKKLSSEVAEVEYGRTNQTYVIFGGEIVSFVSVSLAGNDWGWALCSSLCQSFAELKGIGKGA